MKLKPYFRILSVAPVTLLHAMQITPALPSPYLTRASAATPSAPPPDRVERGTPVAEFLRSLPPIPRGMVIGFSTLSVPMLGGQLGGFPGLALGTGLAFGFNYAIDKDPRRALGTVIWPAVLGGILASTGNPPTALAVGAVAGMGIAFGALAGWRAQLEEKLKA